MAVAIAFALPVQAAALERADLDRAFGRGGKVTTRLDVVLVRLTRRGRLDRSFAGDGVATVDFGSYPEVGTDIAVQPDGSVVVVGSIGTTFPASGTVGDAFVARYHSNGSLDTRFGAGGTVVLRRPESDWYLDAHAVALRPDGTPDTRLGPEGVAYPGLRNGVLRELVVDRRSGRVYLAGHVLSNGDGGDFFLMALRSDLARDDTFGEFGVAQSPLPRGSQEFANSAVVDPRGRVLLGGTALAPDTSRARGSFALARLLHPRGRLVAVGNNASRELGETGPAVTLASYRLGR